MNTPRPAFLLVAALLVCAPCAIAQEPSPAKPAPDASILDSLPDRLKKLDDEVTRKIE